MEKFAFIAGSAHLDIISRTIQTDDTLNKEGQTLITFGGGALNMAINLSILGFPVAYMGVFKNSAISQMVVAEMANQGVRIHSKFVPHIPDASVNLMLEGNAVTNAVASLPITKHDFEPDFIERGLRKASCAIINCTLSPLSLERVVNIANTHNIPVYLAGVSETQSLKIPEIKGQLKQVYLNNFEAESLCAELNTTIQELAEKINCTFVVTHGPAPIHIYQPQTDVTTIPVPETKITGTTLGAGDFLMCKSVYFQELKNMDLKDALNAAVRKMEKILSTDHANIGRNNQLEMNIQDVVHKAHVDKLTKLLNRQGVDHAMLELDPDREHFHAMLIDIDHFKNINDTLGHNAGDEALATVASIIKSCSRYGDIVGRWGGEEFLCLFRGITFSAATQAAERMRERIMEAQIPSLKGRKLTASFGLARRQKQEPFLDLVNRADKALYEAKNTGRNKVCTSDWE